MPPFSGPKLLSKTTYWQRWQTPYGWYNYPRTWEQITEEEYMQNLTFEKVRQVNLERAEVWHPNGIQEWSPAEWGNALAGECGELCNVLKKLLRLDHGINQANGLDRNELVEMAGKEIADVYLYLDLVASRLGLTVASCTVKKFNETSTKEGFPHKL
jgi:NTP pyrophosphatase (non-canonical NTP hydrolase)